MDLFGGSLKLCCEDNTWFVVVGDGSNNEMVSQSFPSLTFPNTHLFHLKLTLQTCYPGLNSASHELL